MSDLSLEERIARLPAWAREYVKEQQDRVRIANEEPLRLKVVIQRLRDLVRVQQDRIDAMVHMFQCAAKGENEVAKAVQRIVEDYIICDSE